MFDKRQVIISILKNVVKACIAIAVGAAVVLIAEKRIAAISTSLSDQRTSVFVLEKRNDVLAELRGEFKKIGNSDAAMENALPPPENILDFITSLESLARENSMQQSLAFSDPTGPTVNYTVALNGTLSAVTNYLKIFERLPYFTVVRSASISANPPGDWDGDSRIVLGAQLYTNRLLQ